MLLTQALGRQKQVNICEFKTSLTHIGSSKTHLKKTNYRKLTRIGLPAVKIATYYYSIQ